MSVTRINNPKLYAKMSAPYATQEEAESALAAFREGVARLRKRHRISDVTYAACVQWANPDGTPTLITGGFHGDEARQGHMLAWALEEARRSSLASALASQPSVAEPNDPSASPSQERAR